MRTTVTAGPSGAERVHNACVHTESALLSLCGAEPCTATFHALRQDGSSIADAVDAVVSIPTATARALPGGAQAVLELIDHAPVPLREPVRSLVWLRGTLCLVPPAAQRALAAEVAERRAQVALLDVGHGRTLLRLRLASAVITDFSGAESVDVAALRQAAPDPFWELEPLWLRHLDDEHPDVLAGMAHRLPAGAPFGRVRPLTLDRYGLTLRVERPDGDHDVRLAFPEPVRNVAALGLAVRRLAGGR